MTSLLDDLKSRQPIKTTLADYQKSLSECPPVSKALIEYLERMFSRKVINPTSASMQQELVFQAGIDSVLLHLRNRNDRQEELIRVDRVKTS